MKKYIIKKRSGIVYSVYYIYFLLYYIIQTLIFTVTAEILIFLKRCSLNCQLLYLNYYTQ